MTQLTRTLLLAVTLVLGIAGSAFAFWSGTGAGTAGGAVRTQDALTFGPGTPAAQLSPGHDAGVAVIATNANPYAVEIASLELDAGAGTGGFDVDGGHSGCVLSVLHVAPQDNGGGGWSVPAKVGSTDGSLAIDLAGALSMDANAASACQGASFTVHLRAAP